MAKNKFHNKKIINEYGEFDSTIEAKRYEYLFKKEQEGEIFNLQRQVEYELLPRQYELVTKVLKTKVKTEEHFLEHPCVYRADFVYEKPATEYIDNVPTFTHKTVVEDVKGRSTGRWSSQTPDFKIKKKLMLYFKGIKVRIVTKPNEEI